MYVLVRDDLSRPQQTVQSCHAIIEGTKAFSLGDLPEHPYVIVLRGGDEQRLQKTREYLTNNSVRHTCFHEPDIGDQLTAIVTEPVTGERRKLFRKFQLLN